MECKFIFSTGCQRGLKRAANEKAVCSVFEPFPTKGLHHVLIDVSFLNVSPQCCLVFPVSPVLPPTPL